MRSWAELRGTWLCLTVCAQQMINFFDQMLHGAGIVTLCFAVLSLVAGIPSKPSSCAVHTTGAHLPQHPAHHEQAQCMPHSGHTAPASHYSENHYSENSENFFSCIKLNSRPKLEIMEQHWPPLPTKHWLFPALDLISCSRKLNLLGYSLQEYNYALFGHTFHSVKIRFWLISLAECLS